MVSGRPFTPGGRVFDTPLNYDWINGREGEPCCTVVLSETTVQMFMALLQQGFVVDNWHHENGDVIFTEDEYFCIRHFTNLAYRELMTCYKPLTSMFMVPGLPCQVWGSFGEDEPEMLFDLSLCNVPLPIELEILENSRAMLQTTIINRFDGVHPSSVNPSSPDDNFDGDASDEREAALCMAIKGYVAAIASEFETRVGFELGLSTVVGIGASVLFPPVLLAVIALHASTDEQLLAARDRQAINDVICCMNAALIGLPITRAGWQASLDGCGFDTDSHQDIVADVVRSSFAHFGNWVVFLDTLGNAFDLAQAGVVDCPCDAGCSTFVHTDAAWSVDVGTVDTGTDIITGDGLDGTQLTFNLPSIRDVVSVVWTDSDTAFNIQSVVIDFFRGTTLVRHAVLFDNIRNSLWVDFVEPGASGIGVQGAPQVDRVVIYNTFSVQDGVFTQKDITICWE